jgi:hypothetical protein
MPDLALHLEGSSEPSRDQVKLQRISFKISQIQITISHDQDITARIQSKLREDQIEFSRKSSAIL